MGLSTTQYITESYPNATSLFIGNASALDTVQLGANSFPRGQHLTLRGTHSAMASQHRSASSQLDGGRRELLQRRRA